MNAARSLVVFFAFTLAISVACTSATDDPVGAASSPPAEDAGVRPPHYDPTPAASPDGTVETHRATSLRTSAFSANGRVHPHGRPTRTWFEYGPTTSYGSRTASRPLGPKLTAHYKESFESGLAGWLGGVEGTALTHVPTGGTPGAFARFSEPTDFDSNHEDGIGFIQLTEYLQIGTFEDSELYNAAWNAGDPDLRDAKISIEVRGTNWSPSTSELVFWAQADLDLRTQNDETWQRANWAHTDFSLSDAVMKGGWQHVEYRLPADTNRWSYGGKNITQDVTVGRERYVYWPLNETLQHLNCNMQHVLAHVLLSAPADGSIDFDEFEVTFRNHSLLIPSNGGKTVTTPPGSDDASTLIDGWRNGPGHTWKSAGSPSAPLELVYELTNGVTVTAVQLHQHPEWPSRDVEVLTSSDGKTWSTQVEGEMPDTSPAGPNHVYLFRRGLDVAARFVKVRILSGYRPEYWGLGEIEVLGTGAEMQTDDDWYTVTDDITGLQPGATYHYRLVSESSAGIVYGGDKTFLIPDGRAPEVETTKAVRVRNGTAQLQGRLNPLGYAATFTFEYGEDTRYGTTTDAFYGGALDTPRTVVANIRELTPGKTYHYRLVVTPDPDRSTKPFQPVRGADATFVAQ